MNRNGKIFHNKMVYISNNPISYCVISTFVISALLYLFPFIDRSFSHLFYVHEQGFPAARIDVLRDFRTLASHLTVALPILLALAIGLKLLYPAKPSLVSPRFSLYFIALFSIGPGLMVNGALKSFWGRPRPVNIEEFGGAWPFQPAWVIGPEGLLNRSFTSGEAATIACLLPLALFVPREWRVQVAAILGVLVAAVSLNRIAFGAHFLSDVTISIGLMLTLAAALYRVIFVDYAETFADAALEARLTAFGELWAGRRAAFRRSIRASLAGAGAAVLALLGAQRAMARRIGASFIGAEAARGMGATVLVLLSSTTGGSSVRRLSQTTPNRS
ncbi:Uncharacterised protein [Starkeya nomas]|uniref:Phosphatidic acid phosphatase type 2/haloperoxidase domain-containing protein n=1 Tax=Starkeya nomas TaxID=2666134 RepID=A0A5S9PIN7_9HYPH|nr:Uncharacterised protein [Starkeya nomas]